MGQATSAGLCDPLVRVRTVLFAPAEPCWCTVLTQEVWNVTLQMYVNAAREICFLLQLMQKIVPSRGAKGFVLKVYSS